MAVYIAYRDEPGDDGTMRYARNSFAKLKEKMRLHPETRWQVVRMAGRGWRERRICLAIEDPTKLKVRDVQVYHVTPTGRVQKKVSDRRVRSG